MTCLSQISMHYNIPPPPDFSAFSITTNTKTKCNINRPQLILFVHVRYSVCVLAVIEIGNLLVSVIQ